MFLDLILGFGFGVNTIYFFQLFHQIAHGVLVLGLILEHISRSLRLNFSMSKCTMGFDSYQWVSGTLWMIRECTRVIFQSEFFPFTRTWIRVRSRCYRYKLNFALSLPWRHIAGKVKRESCITFRDLKLSRWRSLAIHTFSESTSFQNSEVKCQSGYFEIDELFKSNLIGISVRSDFECNFLLRIDSW
mgnify:CR=1 FL=1